MSRIDDLGNLPTWQLALAFVGGAALIGAGWYFVYYKDAVDGRKAAEQGVTKAESSLSEAEKKKASFEADLADHAAREKKQEECKRVLPRSTSAVDNLMRKFQQQARLVGLDIEKWEPQDEEESDFYAKLPVEVKATGTWHEFGEFFRRVDPAARATAAPKKTADGEEEELNCDELDQIVTVENVNFLLKRSGGSRDDDVLGAYPRLEVEFVASTYRFLEDEAAAEPQG